MGAGAAGLAAAIFTARRRPDLRIVALDGARKLGAKILVAGGGRCNVTNVAVSERDYWGGSPAAIRTVLRALPVAETVAFFGELGVALHEEEYGKLFPDSNSARTVLDALLRECRARGVDLRTEHRVERIARAPAGFEITHSQGVLTSRAVVLATGGLSLPKTGSDGGGYALARALGHSLTPTTPGLDPLELAGDFHAPLSGVAHDLELTVHVTGEKPVRLRGPMLWTHFGISGPAALNASRHWNRARLEARPARITANLLPPAAFEQLEARLLELATANPKLHLSTALARGLTTDPSRVVPNPDARNPRPDPSRVVPNPVRVHSNTNPPNLPARVAEALLAHLAIPPATPLAHLARDARRRLLHALTTFELPVTATRGYKYAEVTAGGVPLHELDPKTMHSRICPGLFLVGEVLDVDGRLGGFNFQWAWSGGAAAANGLAAHLPGGP